MCYNIFVNLKAIYYTRHFEITGIATRLIIYYEYYLTIFQITRVKLKEKLINADYNGWINKKRMSWINFLFVNLELKSPIIFIWFLLLYYRHCFIRMPLFFFSFRHSFCLHFFITLIKTLDNKKFWIST